MLAHNVEKQILGINSNYKVVQFSMYILKAWMFTNIMENYVHNAQDIYIIATFLSEPRNISTFL